MIRSYNKVLAATRAIAVEHHFDTHPTHCLATEVVMRALRDLDS